MNLTKAEMEALFKKIGADEEFARDIRKEARELWNTAKDCGSFDNTLKGLFMSCMQSVTAGGIVPKPFGVALLVFFVLGQRYGVSGQPLLLPPGEPHEDIPLTTEEMEKLRKEIDGLL